MAPTAAQTSPRYDRLHFVLGQSDRGEAAIMKDSLHARGIQRVADCGASTDRLFGALDGEIVDLLVYDFDLLRDRFVEAMQMVRRKSRGQNPFVLILATVADSDVETVRSLVKGGVDDLIRRPVTGQRLLESIGGLMDHRKPFVVANDYVGPTRRSTRRAEPPDPRSLMRVPNTMRSRAIDQVSEEEIRRMVDTAVATLRDRQLVACGAQVERLSRQLRDTYRAAADAPERIETVRGLLHKLEVAADDLYGRCQGTEFERVGELAKMVLALTQRIDRGSVGRAGTEVQLLGKLTEAIHRALAVERDSVAVMRDIASAIARFTRNE